MVAEADIEIPPGTYRPTAKQHLLWQYIHDAEPGSLTLLGYGGGFRADFDNWMLSIHGERANA